MRRDVLDRLLLNHNVVHMHVNNGGPVISKLGLQLPSFLEVTYLRKDRAEPLGASKTIPHELDVSNLPDRPAIDVPKCWLR